MKKQNVRAKPAVQADFKHTVRVVRALTGGKFVDGSEFNCDSLQHAKQSADRLQREFDEDCDPCRTYVFNGVNPAPVYAGLARIK